MKDPFSAAYLSGEERALRLMPASYQDEAARRAVARARAGRPVAPALLAELRAQAGAQAAPSAARAAYLEALAEPGTAAVVSGQQVGLSGPLYTIYKAASAIAAARRIAKEAALRCAPIFWLQTEDHDFAEIDHCHILRPGAAPLRLQVTAAGHARASVADLRLGPDVTAAVAAAEEALAGLPHAAEVIGLLRAHYVPGASPGGAFAGLLSALFAEDGLLVLDPRRPAVARLAAPSYRRALEDAPAIEAALAARGQALGAAGFAEQVHPRPGASLLFFHDGAAGPDGAAAGPRHRLERGADGRFTLAGARAASPPRSLDELLGELDRDPLRFSTSALLRPLVQDALLPTAAYIGGPGEINYLAQLPPLYELFGLPPPLVAPRARLRCLEDNTRALLRKLGLVAADAERPRDELRRRCAGPAEALGNHRPPEAVRDELLAQVLPRLDELAALDPSLREPARQARQSIERNLARLVERYGRALLERDRVTTERVDRLRGFLFPEDAPQERIGSVLYFLARHGVAAYKARLFEAIVPFRAGVQDLEL